MTRPFTVVALGEVLWDVFPDGPRFGGAPANFASHAAMLGADVHLVSQVGQDELGEEALHSLQGHGVNARFVSRSVQYPTGKVLVELDHAGQPEYRIAENVAWDHIPWSDALEDLAHQADAVCYGTLAQRGEESRQTIRRFLQATRPECLRIFDVNLRQHYYDARSVLASLQLATALKLNEDELPIVMRHADLSSDDDLDSLRLLREQYPLRLVALTRGADGATLLAERISADCEAIPVAVRDTVGAGDAFTAAMTLLWLQGRPLSEICEHACRVAAFVCSQPGATPTLPEEYRLRPVAT